MKLLNPDYIVGFVDGEGCFSVTISQHRTLKRRLEVRPLFEIELREDDREILDRLQYTFQCGSVYHLTYRRYDWAPHVKYKVSKIHDLTNIIIPFFDRYHLQAKKRKQYLLFRKAVRVVYKKQHLTNDGFEKILSIREQMREFSKKHYRNR